VRELPRPPIAALRGDTCREGSVGGSGKEGRGRS